jgi:two-component system, NarL family, sensor kinase
VSPALDQVRRGGALRKGVTQLQHQTPQSALSLHLPDQDPGTLRAAVEVAGYWVITRAVTNTLRHAGACRADVLITITARELRLQVDDGAGRPEDWRAGVGISAVHEQAVELGGQLTIQPRSPSMTRIIAGLPLCNPA